MGLDPDAVCAMQAECDACHRTPRCGWCSDGGRLGNGTCTAGTPVAAGLPFVGYGALPGQCANPGGYSWWQCPDTDRCAATPGVCGPNAGVRRSVDPRHGVC